jgi:hypothetical protein
LLHSRVSCKCSCLKTSLGRGDGFGALWPCFLQLSLEPRSMRGEHPSIADERCDNQRAARLGTICPDVLNLSDYPHSS